jgi:hypothetical protein
MMLIAAFHRCIYKKKGGVFFFFFFFFFSQEERLLDEVACTNEKGTKDTIDDLTDTKM